MGTLSMGASTKVRSGSSGNSKKEYKVAVKLARHMQGPNRGQHSGKAMYTILCAYEENEALYKLERDFHTKPRWFKDWGAHVVECPSDKLAMKLHKAILKAARGHRGHEPRAS